MAEDMTNDDDTPVRDDEVPGEHADSDWKHPHSRSSEAGAPGASAPGEPGYEGEVTIGDIGGSAHPIEFGDQFGRPDTGGEGAGDAVPSPS